MELDNFLNKIDLSTLNLKELYLLLKIINELNCDVDEIEVLE